MLSTRTTNTNSSSCSPPFTATQWQELEHQALIYKYMVSGLPIPPQLLSPLTWGSCFQVGFPKKTDLEPGRCRRTDGKKWRCSKEAYPDSKYCERHMHRGKNRSRKATVDVSSSSSSYARNVLANVNGVGGINQYGQSALFTDSAANSVSSPCQVHLPDYNRYVHGVKVEDNMQQLSSSSSSKGYYCSPQSDLQSFPYPSMRPIISYSHETQKPLHQFFGGTTDHSWLDLASSSRPS